MSKNYPEFEYGFRINPDSDPDVCRIAPKMWIHFLVGVSHFVECRENRPCDMKNVNISKMPYK